MKTISLILLLSGLSLWAQVPPTKKLPPPEDVPPAAPAAPDEVFRAGMINFQGMDLSQALEFYAKLVNRTVLRGMNLPNTPIILKSQTDLTKQEAIQALDAVFALNNIAMINVGGKFVKAVPIGAAGPESPELQTNGISSLPDMGQYTTRIVQLKYVKPSELLQVLGPFSKAPNPIMAIDSSQILVLRDYADNIKRMMEMIDKIDVEVPSEFLSEVIPMKYAKAADIASALGSLGGGAGATVGTSRRAGGGRGAGFGFGNQPGVGYAGQTQPGVTQPGVGGMQPQQAGNTFQSRLQSIIHQAASAGEIQLLGPTKIIADERTNSLLVFASRDDMKMIKDVVSKLDRILAQVLIESVIMEVSLNDSQDIGFSYLQTPQSAGKFGGAGALNNGTMLSQGSFVSGISNVVGSLPSGFSYFGTYGNNLQATMTAIAQNGTINVLSRPTIQTSHAVEADIFIGQTVPYITGSIYGAYGGVGAQSTYQQTPVGISLDVTPYINPDGLVVMDIIQKVSQLGTPVTIDGNQVPTTTERDANATVAVKDGDTIMLGGFMSTTTSKTRSGVPFLKDIPLLGYLFRSTSDSSQRTELIVLIRPKVLPTPESASMAATEAQNQLPDVRRAQKEIQADDDRRLKEVEKEFGHGTQKSAPTPQ